MVNNAYSTVSYKVHKTKLIPEDQQQIIPDQQEAIISEEDWLRVQELRINRRRPMKSGKTSMFSGLLFCHDCGSKLHFCTCKRFGPEQDFYRCSLEEYFAYDINEYYNSIQMDLPALYYSGRCNPPRPERWFSYFLRMVMLYSNKVCELSENSNREEVTGSMSYLKGKHLLS